MDNEVYDKFGYYISKMIEKMRARENLVINCFGQPRSNMSQSAIMLLDKAEPGDTIFFHEPSGIVKLIHKPDDWKDVAWEVYQAIHCQKRKR